MDQNELESLADEIGRRYPYPLAATYHRAYFGALDLDEVHDYLLDLSELTLKYFASIVMAQYFKDGARDPEINADLLHLQRPSLGHWQGWLRDILEFYRRQRRALLVPELASFYNQKHTGEILRATSVLRQIMTERMGYEGGVRNPSNVITRQFFELLGEYRNKLAHGARPSRYDRERVANLLMPALSELFRAMSWIADYRLVYISSVNVEFDPNHPGTFHFAHRLIYLTGDRPRVSQKSQVLDGTPARDKELYVLDKSGDFHPLASLHPLIIYRHCESCNREQAFVLNMSKENAADYVSYQCTHHFSPTEYLDYMHTLLSGLRDTGVLGELESEEEEKGDGAIAGPIKETEQSGPPQGSQAETLALPETSAQNEVEELARQQKEETERAATEQAQREEALRLAEQQAAQDAERSREAALLEKERVAREEAERLALQTAQEEAARKAAQEESERIAEQRLKAEREEAERMAAQKEKALRDEAERKLREEDAARLAEQQAALIAEQRREAERADKERAEKAGAEEAEKVARHAREEEARKAALPERETLILPDVDAEPDPAPAPKRKDLVSLTGRSRGMRIAVAGVLSMLIAFALLFVLSRILQPPPGPATAAVEVVTVPLVSVSHGGEVVRSVAFSRSGILASGGNDSRMRLWDAGTYHSGAVMSHDGFVTGVAFSPDGLTVASVSEDDKLRGWSVPDGALLFTSALGSHPAGVAFSPDGKIIAVGSLDSNIYLLSAGTGSPMRTLGGHKDGVHSVAFSPDGQTLASGSYDKTIRLWRISDGTAVRTLESGGQLVESVAFSPDGQTLAAWLSNGSVKVWRTSDWTLLRTLEGHTSSVQSVAYSPGGQTLASGSFDGTVRLWGTLSWTNRLIIGEKGTNGIIGVAFSPDGKAIATGDLNYQVQIWSAGGEAASAVQTATPQASPGATDTPPATDVAANTPSPGAAAQETPTGQPAGVIVFGAFLPLSGSLSTQGTSMQQGYELWKEWANASGGIIAGGRAYKVEIKYFDQLGAADTSARAQAMALAGEVDFFLGGYGSVSNLALSGVTENLQVPVVEGGGSDDTIFAQGYKYTFGVLSPASWRLKSVIDMAVAQEPKPKSVVIVAADDTVSTFISKGAEQEAMDKGLTVQVSTYAVATHDFTFIVADLKTFHPDLVLHAGPADNATYLIAAMKGAGVSPMAIGVSSGAFSDATTTQLGGHVLTDYVYDTVQWNDSMNYQGGRYWNTPKLYASAFENRWSTPPSELSAMAIASGMVFQEAIERAGTTDRKAVRDALASTDFMSFAGRMKFNEQGSNIYKAVPVEQASPLKFTDTRDCVWPPEAASAKPLWPTPAWDKR